jgi:hypothetical protein
MCSSWISFRQPFQRSRLMSDESILALLMRITARYSRFAVVYTQIAHASTRENSNMHLALAFCGDSASRSGMSDVRFTLQITRLPHHYSSLQISVSIQNTSVKEQSGILVTWSKSWWRFVKEPRTALAENVVYVRAEIEIKWLGWMPTTLRACLLP